MDITWLGHSCFRIKGNQAIIITDPFPPDIGYTLGKQTANIVTVSHQHPSHSYAQGIGGEPRILQRPGEYEISGVLIIGISTFHDSVKGTSRGKNTAYLMEIDGMAVCHLGDIGHLPYCEGFFDKVLLSEVLEHLEDDLLALREVWHVLRPGGTLVVTVPYADYPFFYDPINWICDRLLHHPIRTGPLAGAWMDHRRLYRREDLLGLVRRAGFVVLDCQMLTSSCFPFTHNLVYGIGKNLRQQQKLPSFFLDEVDRFHPEAGKRKFWNPMTWLMRSIEWIDQFNVDASGKSRFVNIGLKARKQ